MGWRFRKRFQRGPAKAVLTKNGVGGSFKLFGLFNVGVTPQGVPYFSFGIPGTGLYYQTNTNKNK